MTPRERLAQAAIEFAEACAADKNSAFEILVRAAEELPHESDADEYQRQALRTEKTPLFVNGPDGKPSELLSRAMHGAMGMVTEAGEAMDMLKKHLVYGKEFDVINAIEEAGDKQWYIALFLDAVGFTMSEAQRRNIAKLRARYPQRFTEAQAITRDLDAERAALARPSLSICEHPNEVPHVCPCPEICVCRQLSCKGRYR